MPEKVEKIVNDTDEEVVLYDVEKHWMSLVLPAFLIPFFFFYFWNIFLNSHSFLSWVITIALLFLILYPIARYKSDRMIITNKFAHVKIGVLNPEEKEIPIEKLDMISITQSSTGRMFNYASVTINDEFNSSFDYGRIKEPEELQYIIDDPLRFVKESM